MNFTYTTDEARSIGPTPPSQDSSMLEVPFIDDVAILIATKDHFIEQPASAYFARSAGRRGKKLL